MVCSAWPSVISWVCGIFFTFHLRVVSVQSHIVLGNKFRIIFEGNRLGRRSVRWQLKISTKSHPRRWHMDRRSSRSVDGWRRWSIREVWQCMELWMQVTDLTSNHGSSYTFVDWFTEVEVLVPNEIPNMEPH